MEEGTAPDTSVPEDAESEEADGVDAEEGVDAVDDAMADSDVDDDEGEDAGDGDKGEEEDTDDDGEAEDSIGAVGARLDTGFLSFIGEVSFTRA